MKPFVDAFHFSVGHIALVVVVMSKVKHFRAFATPPHARGTGAHYIPAGQ